MGDLADGDSLEVKGSAAKPYLLKNSGGVYSCTCPAWMHQSVAIERRTCKHLRNLRGDEAEQARVGDAALAGKPVRPRPAPRGDGTEEPAAASAVDAAEPPLLLAHKWEVEVDLTGWWLSEKLDGVRAYWDGTQFLSRLGNRFHAPEWFVEGLPSTPLDGELWGGRKLFQRTVGIVKRQDKSPLWRDLAYVVFDAPAHGGTFEERIAHCEATLGKQNHPHARVHAHEPCRGLDHLREELARVEALGGEGLMARKPHSRYEVGRSATLLKVKTFKDAEARVIGHVPGAGRHKGRLGALFVELADGTKFNVGTGFSDRERESPPAIGALITFRYQELSDGGVPRFPTYVCERIDARTPSLLAPEPRPQKTQAAKPPAKATPGEATASAKVPAAAAEPAPGASEAGEPAARTTTTPAARPGLRRFELVEGTSSKFWEISREGVVVRVRYGRIGSQGQTTLKEHPSEDKARADVDRLVIEKTRKGYSEC